MNRREIAKIHLRLLHTTNKGCLIAVCICLTVSIINRILNPYAVLFALITVSLLETLRHRPWKELAQKYQGEKRKPGVEPSCLTQETDCLKMLWKQKGPPIPLCRILIHQENKQENLVRRHWVTKSAWAKLIKWHDLATRGGMVSEFPTPKLQFIAGFFLKLTPWR